MHDTPYPFQTFHENDPDRRRRWFEETDFELENRRAGRSALLALLVLLCIFGCLEISIWFQPVIYAVMNISPPNLRAAGLQHR
jgi:hypothetical protein